MKACEKLPQTLHVKMSRLLIFFVVTPIIVLSIFSQVIFTTSPVYAATGVNKQINFQGKLVNTDGTNVADNTYSVVFTLYTAASSGTTLWTETQNVSTTDGIFQVSLGSVTSLASVNFNADNIYLGIKVGADTEMTPRIRFTAVPYAFNADKLNGVTATQSATGFTLTGGTSTAKTLTLTNDITLGSTITPTNTGALTLQSNGANGLTLDTGGAAGLSIGTTNANGLSLSKAGTTTTINGGLSITTGQNFLVNGDTFTDLTGSGLVVSSNALTINLTSSGSTGATSANSGLEVSSAGLTLLKGCSDGQLLEYTDAGGWACANDDNGGGGGGASNWTLAAGGILRPNNNTLDLLIGGISTASAKFGLLNVAGGTPTASISGDSGANATALSGLGVLGTTNKQTLMLGNTTTGNVSLAPGGTTALTGIANGSIGIGTTAPLATLDVRGNLATIPAASVSANSNFAALVVNNTGTGDIFTASAGGQTRMVISSAGHLGIGTELPTANLHIVQTEEFREGLSIQSYDGGLFGAYPFLIRASDTAVAFAYQDEVRETTIRGNSSFWDAPALKIEGLNDDEDILRINNATSTKKFVVVNGSGTNATASISGTTSFATMLVNNDGRGDLLTASSSGKTRFRMTNNGSVLYQGDLLAATGNGATGNGSDAVINAIGDQGSLVPNAGFESNFLGGIADGWTIAASSAGKIARDSTTTIKGDTSISVTLSNSSAAIYSACIPLAANIGQYTLNYYAKLAATARIVTIRTYIDGYATKTNCQSDTSPLTSTATTGTFTVNTNWQRLGSNTTAMAGVNSAVRWGRVHFFFGYANAGTAAVINLDGVRLTQSTTGQGLDYAENYPVDPTNVPEAGDVVALTSSSTAAEIAPAKKYMDQSVIGVVSTNPGQVLDDEEVPDPKVPVALNGRVPVKVSTKNGAIRIGDYLTSSTIPGVAVKATKAGPVIGTALEGFDSTDPGKVLMFVKNTYYNGQANSDSGLAMENGQDSTAFLSMVSPTQAGNVLGTAGIAETATPSLTSLSIDGLATVSANFRVKGDSLFEGVVKVIDTFMATNIIVSKTADFFGNVIFRSDVSFRGRATFNNDVAGFAVIKKGSDQIQVTFENEYEQSPIVTASFALDALSPSPEESADSFKARQYAQEKELLEKDLRLFITKRTGKGFTILLNNPVEADVTVSWNATAVKDARVITSTNELVSPKSSESGEKK